MQVQLFVELLNHYIYYYEKGSDQVCILVNSFLPLITVWLVDWGLTFHQQLRSYGDGTSVYCPIRRTGEARDRTCDPGLQGE